jgi:N-carbamoylputrescine amidase
LPNFAKKTLQSELIKIGLIQRSCADDVMVNLDGTLLAIRNAAQNGANIVCLSELFMSRYFCDEENYDNFNYAEIIPGPTTQKMQKLAAELNVVIVASLFEKVDAGIYFNTGVVIDADGSYLGKYRKNHIPDDPGYFEKFYFSPGDTGYQVFNSRFGRIGVLICWDQWYPEAARITSLLGAQILFYPTAIGWSLSQNEDTNIEQYQAWQTIQRGHAIANGVYVIAVNRFGIEKQMQFWGGSFIANPFGKIEYQSPHNTEDIRVVEIDMSLSDFYRVHWPFMRDRRIDTYKPLLNRYLKS